MAMYAMLRRASSTALPQLARRATASSSSRNFQNVLSVFHRETTATSIAPSLRFANTFATKTSADDSLVQVLQSEIQCALEDDRAQHQVHARCYGELEPVNGVLWLCNLCRSGAPPPPCCLCPLIGGAVKPTIDGRWAHLACGMWIPETCLADVKRMEPIDGLSRISKDRRKLLCSICGVSYGACIQCSNNSCRVAYHPLCALAAGLCVELENEDRLYLLSVDDDEDQCIRLLSFCKKHRQPSNEHSVADERIV